MTDGTPVRLLVGWLAWGEKSGPGKNGRDRPGDCRVIPAGEPLVFRCRHPTRRGVAVVRDAGGRDWPVPADLLEERDA
jgi:hypothetical protein